MSDTTLRDLVLKRLDADTKPEDEWSALGFDALVDAPNALQQARSARDKAPKDADQDRTTILVRLDEVSDERAGRVKEALGKKDWGLDEVEAVLGGSPTTGEKDGATETRECSVVPFLVPHLAPGD